MELKRMLDRRSIAKYFYFIYYGTKYKYGCILKNNQQNIAKLKNKSYTLRKPNELLLSSLLEELKPSCLHRELIDIHQSPHSLLFLVFRILEHTICDHLVNETLLLKLPLAGFQKKILLLSFISHQNLYRFIQPFQIVV